MNAAYVLHSKRTRLPDGVGEAWIVIGEGKIVDVLRENPKSPTGTPFTDLPIESFGEKVLMPGLIDAHVHINEPGRTEWEGFHTATQAAAAGGITTLVDMPLNSSPVTTTLAALDEKLAAAKGKLHVNCGFYGGIVPGNTDDLQPLIDAGVLGIKAFLSHSGIDEFPNVTEEDLRKGMPIIGKAGLPLLAHAELVAPLDDAVGQALVARPRVHAGWLNTRPPSFEVNAIALLIRLARETGCRTHVVHLSAAEALPMIAEARKALNAPSAPDTLNALNTPNTPNTLNVPRFTVETCPHYLAFAAEDIPDGATIYKCAPPIRDRANNDRLWEALHTGLIDFIVTDHSPATPSLKGLDTGNFATAWGGIASLQFSLPAVWAAAHRYAERTGTPNSPTLAQISNWMSTHVADFLGLGHRKGRIAPGYDADLTVWAPEETFIPTAADIRHRHPVSPYVGKSLQGRIHQTWVNGKKVYDQGRFSNLGAGNILLRERK